MPKALEENTTELKPKRAPRKRVAAVRSPRKRVAKKPLETEAVLEASVSDTDVTAVSKRKAPTKLNPETSEVMARKQSYRSLYIVGALFAVGFGAAATIGYSDAGQINIASVVSERNTRVAAGNINPEIDGDSPTAMIVPVQNNGEQVIDGGLERTVNPPALVPTSTVVEDLSSTTATSTEVVSPVDPEQASSSVSDLESETDTAGQSETEESVVPENTRL